MEKTNDNKVITEVQDLLYLKWSHVRASSGTAGSFLKAQSLLAGKKEYYKLSNYDSEKGIIGHECVNEIIVDRLLSVLGIEHLEYQLIHARIEIDGREHITWLCKSEDFKKSGERKASLDDFFQFNSKFGERHYDFCKRMGWQAYIDTMLAVDFLILNRDRHGANIEVLQNQREKTWRIAPLFDHGLSLLYSCLTEKDVESYDVMDDKQCQCFVGGRSTLENLSIIEEKHSIFQKKLVEADKEILMKDLEEVLPKEYLDKIWEMIWSRWKYYENL